MKASVSLTLNLLCAAESFTLNNGAPSASVASRTASDAPPPARLRAVVSPFDSGGGAAALDDDDDFDRQGPAPTGEGYSPLPTGDDDVLELTWDNVDRVLDEMRPYLIQDGGNVAIADIDGPVVRLELQGECGTCPSSTQTMKMGLERKLRERIPEIQEVVQALPDSPDLTEEQINVVLDSVRPFLQVAGGTIDVADISGEGGVQPTITLKMEGSAASLNSVKL